MKIKLTKYGECVKCGGHLLAELAVYPSDPCCHDCTEVRLVEAGADGSKTYQFADGYVLSHDAGGHVLRYGYVPIRL